MVESSLLLIGELATRTGVSIKAIRHYERLGLVYSAGRTEGNYRLYPPEAIACVEVIKLWRRLGFSLKEMVALAHLVDSGPRDDLDHQLLAALRHKEGELTEQITQLERLRGAIRAFCAGYEATLHCGEGAFDRWQAMQAQAREEYRQGSRRDRTRSDA